MIRRDEAERGRAATSHRRSSAGEAGRRGGPAAGSATPAAAGRAGRSRRACKRKPPVAPERGRGEGGGGGGFRLCTGTHIHTQCTLLSVVDWQVLLGVCFPCRAVNSTQTTHTCLHAQAQMYHSNDDHQIDHIHLAISHYHTDPATHLFYFVLFTLQLSLCLWWHDYRRDCHSFDQGQPRVPAVRSVTCSESMPFEL